MIFYNKKKDLNLLQFPENIEISGKNYDIEVVFSSKRSSSVVINKNKLVFRMSSSLSEKLAQEHFAELLKKIYKKIEKSSNIKNEYTIEDVLANNQFVFSNQIYFIEYTKKTKGVKLIENKFHINYQTKKESIEKAIIKILIKIYSQRVQNYVLKLNSQTYKYEIKEIQLKYANSKWGHCTPDNKLMLNLKLLNAPIEILDYVIIHELAHIKYKDHSQRYWNEVKKFSPNYLTLRKQLKTNPPMLFYKIENEKN